MVQRGGFMSCCDGVLVDRGYEAGGGREKADDVNLNFDHRTLTTSRDYVQVGGLVHHPSTLKDIAQFK